MMDGRYITEARTAAVSAVSARFLAKPDASTLAIIGSGVQARSHLEALQHVRQLKDVRVWSPRPRSREQFVDEMSPASPADRRGDTAEAAVARRRSDRARDLVADPGDREMRGVPRRARGVRRRVPARSARDGAGAGQAGRLYVDSRAAALVESGDVVMNIADGLFDESHVRGELGELVLGRASGRGAESDVTIFKSLGMAVEDVVAADLVFRRAAETGAGTELTL